jgi:hypothetical protein
MADTYKEPPKPDEQVGGTHYSRLGIEPIQFIETNALGYHEGNVIKYISRWRNKNGLEDLNKAKWYIERLIELETSKLEHEDQVEAEITEAAARAEELFESIVADEDVVKEVCSKRSTPHTERVTKQEAEMFDAARWFQVNKGLVATPRYDDIGVPAGLYVYLEDGTQKSYTFGECRWYASEYRRTTKKS